MKAAVASKSFMELSARMPVKQFNEREQITRDKTKRS